MNAELIFTLYSDKRTVFSFLEIAMLSGESDMARLKQRINYYVRTKKLINLRRGIYAKENYAPEELACKIFKPAYISLEYVLQKEGIVFQYNPVITILSYLSRNLKIDNHQLHYRKIKDNILYNASGITMSSTGISMATPERALLDKLYLDQAYYFDSTTALNKDKLVELLSVYQSARLEKTALTIIEHARY